MKIHELEQGSKEWVAFRANKFTASDAPAMLGMSKYKSRTQLLDEKKTGITPDVDARTQARFDDGHAAEASACTVLEKLTGLEFFPVTGTHDDEENIAASLDGITDPLLCEKKIIFEHKLFNKALIKYIEDNQDLPDTHWPQVEQQLFVSGADYCVFVVSDGGEENRFEFDYYPRKERCEEILNGWAQFKKDLENHKPSEVDVKPVAKTLEAPINIMVRLSGHVEESNLPQVKAAALAVFEGINRDLKTDEDFVNAESTVKWCKSIERKLEGAKENALAQTKSIDNLFSTIDAISDEARSIRLELDKLVKNKKLMRKQEIALSARKDLEEYVSELNNKCQNFLKMPTFDIDGAMKGKKTISSLVDAANTAVAQTKIEINKEAADIQANIATIEAVGKDYMFLFSDVADLVTVSPHYLPLQITKRVDDYKSDQERIALEAEAREKAAIEAKEKAEQEAAEAKRQAEIDAATAKARAEEQAKHAAEQARINEVRRQEEIAAKELAEKAKREADKKHIGKIRKEAKESFMVNFGLDEATAKKVVLAISKKQVANISINY